MNINVQAWMRAAGTPRRRRRVVLRPIGATVASQEAIRAPAVRMLRLMAERVAQDVLPAAVSAKAQMRDDLNWFERAFRALRDLVDGFVEGVRSEFRQAFETEDQRHRRRFNEAMRSAIGIDLGAAIVAEGIEAQVAGAVQQSVSLTRGLGSEVARRLEAKLLAALVQGMSNAELAKLITAEFGIGRRRAALIARDQAASFNGNLNRIRQGAAGVTEYVWSSSLDERVRGNPDGRYPTARPSHWDREGKTFRWSAPPSDGHPGIPINCRCTARAVIEF